MAIKKSKPTSPGRRHASFDDGADLTKFHPEKNLTVIKKRSGGRNNQGKITIRHRGGGAKRFIRLVDFKRDKYGVPAKVAGIEYDPNRGARLALLHYVDGAKTYIIAPSELKTGDRIVSSREHIEIKAGNAMPIRFIVPGIFVHNVELEPGRGGRIARGAGNYVQVMGAEGKNVQIKLPSGEIRLVKGECLCTVGQSSNADRRHLVIGKAGRMRNLGRRPTVRGTAMNPNDHPHGGGEGKQPIGLRRPKTPWGKPALGVRTRKKKSKSDRLIVKRRR